MAKMLNDGMPTIEFSNTPCGRLTGAVKSLGKIYSIKPIRRGRYKHRVEVTIMKNGSGYDTIIVHPLSIELKETSDD